MLIGHEQLIKDFKQFADRNELSHGYIFSGPPRVGKKLFALSFANFLETGIFDEPKMLRDGFLGEPDENRTARGESFDIVQGKRSRTIGIDEIRKIKDFLWQKPIVSKKRTIIIDEAETMTGEAQNALLKIAEEPPESSLLILIVRDPEKLLPTLRSRLQKVYFSPVPPALIENWLIVRLHSQREEKFDGDRKQIQSAVTSSSGQPGLAWKMLSDERFRTLWKSGENLLKSGFWARREMIKALLEKDDFNLDDFLEILMMILSTERVSGSINRKLWHRILDVRRNADYLNLNPRLQLENLMNEM